MCSEYDTNVSALALVCGLPTMNAILYGNIYASHSFEFGLNFVMHSLFAHHSSFLENQAHNSYSYL